VKRWITKIGFVASLFSCCKSFIPYGFVVKSVGWGKLNG